MHDSAESYPQPKCHPETRTKMLEDLQTWALDKDAEQKILWLHGPAGAGKSVIMQTLARQLEDGRRLGGSFFFKRGDPTRGNGKMLFATIAYQLALSVPYLRTQISQIVEDDPSIVRRTIETQMIKLISEPCRSHRNDDHVTVLIDGLDECEHHGVQQEILRAIRLISSKSPIFLRFIVASRPEPHIREVFESPVYADIHRSFNVEQSFDDVRKYFRDEFAQIHRQHRSMTHILLPWPSPDIVQKLVQKSSGYFIYASTVIKFIDDKSHRPTHRLALVLDRNGMGSGSAFDALDQLYMTILSSAPRQSEFMPILFILANYGSPAVSTIDELLGHEMGETKLLLRGLHSIVAIYSGQETQDIIKPHHASFLDFLNSASRSQKFHARSLQNRMHLARGFLHFSAGRFRWKYFDDIPSPSQQVVNRELMPLITSLPPSVELCTLIGRLNPEHIFNLESDLKNKVSWFKKISSAPADLVKLWEDYVLMSYFMSYFKKLRGKAQVETCSKMPLDSGHAVLPSHEIIIPQVIVAMVFLGIPVWRVPGRTGITWDDLRASICGIRPIIPRYDQGPPVRIVLQLFPREAYSRGSRDLALRCIPRMLKNPLSPIMRTIEVDVWERFALLVRLSPPCPELYRELWSIQFPRRYWLSTAEMIIYHVSKWLESFPEPRVELIAFWRNGRTPEDAANAARWAVRGRQGWEGEWRRSVERWNGTIMRLHLPDGLKFPLEIHDEFTDSDSDDSDSDYSVPRSSQTAF
ncbi:hypothetical protein C8R45DRAFT_190209 [Mycena sanguinolenta]|nr:hypothetical protein C8R45DRAFT_190209 [Mycena sanguinolenta]